MKHTGTISKYIAITCIVAAFFILPVHALASNAYQTIEQTITSGAVCSEGTHNTCGPSDSKNVKAPDGAVRVRIEVYWHQKGEPGQKQPNEHSYFTLRSNGQILGQVYCPDLGEAGDPDVLCGTVEADVTPGQTLRLDIRHGDETAGSTPGSTRQVYKITWFLAPPPTDTPVMPPPATATLEPTPTVTEVSPTPTEPGPTQTPPGPDLPPTATSTLPVAQPTPFVTPSPTPDGPTETVPVPPPATTTLEPTPTSPGETDEPNQPVRTPTRPAPAGTLPPPPTASAGVPAVILPQTGLDLSLAAENTPLLLPKLGMILFGLGMVAVGMLRKLRK
ncbi:MAG: hypothetical protein GX495_09035 [Chloroflexi bacterium]|nr:hypothetical protein [Chloroflexota bacterium]